MTSIQSPSRLDALRDTGLLDSQPEEAFDRLTRLCALTLGVPIALVSLVDGDREFFKSSVGLEGTVAAERSVPILHSFCQYVVESGEALVVEDALLHPLLRDNHTARNYGMRAYAGVPLITPAGHSLGAFCAIDKVARAWSATDISVLTDLAAATVTEIVLRRTHTHRGREHPPGSRAGAGTATNHIAVRAGPCVHRHCLWAGPSL